MDKERIAQIAQWAAALRCSDLDDPGLPLSVEEGAHKNEYGENVEFLAVCINEEGPTPIAHVYPAADADHPDRGVAEAIAGIGLGVYELIAEIRRLQNVITATERFAANLSKAIDGRAAHEDMLAGIP